MTFLYTNVKLNLPPHLNYVAALPCKCTRSAHRARETVDLNSAPRNIRLYSARPVASKYTRSKPSRLQDLDYRATSCLYQTKICSVDERRVIDVCMVRGLEQLTAWCNTYLHARELREKELKRPNFENYVYRIPVGLLYV